jgi:Zn-dependent M28 family amino/carboxypeptidase
MVASPNGYAGVYDEPAAAPGSDAARDLLREAVERAGGTPVAVDIHGSSDHYPFSLAGVPTGGVFSGAIEAVTDDQAGASGATAGEPADACYHQACDELDDIDLGLARVLAAALADVTVGVADDPGVLGTGRDR